MIGVMFSILCLGLGAFAAFTERYTPPNAFRLRNKPLGSYFGFFYGYLAGLFIILFNFLIFPTIGTPSIILIIIIDVFWGLSCGVAIIGGFLYDDEKGF
jgi:hypothetical protein